jgi:hypothetical protein
MPDMVLAFLRLPDDGKTAVVHPAGLADIGRLEELPRPTRAVHKYGIGDRHNWSIPAACGGYCHGRGR